MTSISIKRFRVESVLKGFRASVFLTLTTPDLCDLVEIRQRWRTFRHAYFRAARFKKVPKYLMVYEPHPKGHGWHVHVVIESGFLPVDTIRLISCRAGFGRIQIERCFNLDKVACYLSKYLTKAIMNAQTLGVSRVRLVNMSRGLTRLSDCSSEDSFTAVSRYVSRLPLSVFDGLSPIQRYQFVRCYLLFGEYFCPPDLALDRAIKNYVFLVAHPFIL